MNFRKRTIILALALALALAFVDLYLSRQSAISSAALSIPVEKRTTLRVGSTLVSAIVADTPALREQGLSGRPALAENEGMLFVFDHPDNYAFWMKDMLFPIDIVWLDANGRVVDVSPDLLPSSYPTLFTPKEKAEYVIELPDGWALRHNVKVGDLVIIQTQ